MSRRRIAAALAAGALLVLAGCGGGSDSGTPQGDVGGPTIGVPITLADCADWQGATTEERLGTIAQIRNFAGGPIGSGDLRGSTLEDDDAYDVMEGFCANEYARGFRLYKLYTRAATFAPAAERLKELQAGG